MLVLTRRLHEVISIYPDDLPPDMTVAELFADGQIAIEVLGITGNQMACFSHRCRRMFGIPVTSLG